jgi:hypothetical protein
LGAFDESSLKGTPMATLWKLVQGISGENSGRACRRCGESIPEDDHFGFSEQVCRPCRQDHR